MEGCGECDDVVDVCRLVLKGGVFYGFIAFGRVWCGVARAAPVVKVCCGTDTLSGVTGP